MKTKKTKTAVGNKTGMKVSKVKKSIEKRNITKSLWFDLTNEDNLAFLKALTSLYTNKAIKENELKDIGKKFKQEIGEIDSEIAEKYGIVKAKGEFREVDCVEVLDFMKKEVRYVVKGKVHISRPMDDREKQMSLTIKSKPIVSAVGSNKPVPNDGSSIKDAKVQRSNEVKEVMNSETSKSTKKSAVDTVANVRSDAHAELSGGGA